MNKAIFTILLFLPILIFGQSYCDKYSTDYIPIDLTDAITYLDCKWSEKDKEWYKNKTENDATSSIHLFYGTNIRNNWGLWKGNSKLYDYFSKNGITNAESISGIIFTSFYRYLNNKSIDFETQIKEDKEYWEELEKTTKEREFKEFSEFKIGDKVEFSYDYDFVSKRQEQKWMDDKCYAQGIVTNLDSAKLELKVKLKKSCDRKGIVILKYDVWDKIDGIYQKIEEDKIEIMKKGETRWTSYQLWDVTE